MADGDILVLTGGHESFSAGTAVVSGLPRIAVAGSNTTYSAGTLVLTGAGAATIASGAGSLIVSVPLQSAQTFLGGLANSETTYTSGTVKLSELGAITIRSTTGSQLQLSVAAQTAQTGISGIGNSQTTYSSGTVGFLEGGNLTIRSTTGNQFQFSVPAQSVQAETQTFVGGIAVNALTTYTSGTVVLSAGDNVTLGTNAQTVTISGVPAQTVQTQNMVALSVSDALFSSGTVVLTGAGGGATVNTAAGSIRVSVAAPVAQTNQTVGLYALSQTTGGASSTTLDARTLSINAYGALSAGFTNGSIQISAPNTIAQSVQTQNLVAISASDALFSSGTVTMSGYGAATVNTAAGQIRISVPTQTVQAETQTFVAGLQNSQTTYTSGTVNLSVVAGNLTIRSTTGQAFQFSMSQTVQAETQTFLGALQNSETTYTSGTVNLSVVGGQLTIRSTTGNAFQFSAAAAQTGISALSNSNTTYSSGTVGLSELGAITIRSTTGNQFQFSVNSQTNQTLGMYALSQTTGGSSSTTVDARTLSLNAYGILSVGYSAGSVQLSAPNQTAMTATSVSSVSSANAVGANNSRFAMEAHIHEGVRRVGMSTGGNTLGTTGVFPASNFVLAAGSGISLSQATDAASNNTLSIVGPGVLSFYHANIEAMYSSSSSVPINTSVSLVRMMIPEQISFSRVDIPVSMSLNTAGTTATAAIAVSAVGVIYSRNASTLNAIVGQSSTTTYSYASNTGVFSSVSGARLWSFNLATQLSAGEYYLGFQLSTATSSVGASTTNLGGTVGMIFGTTYTAAPWRLMSADPTVSTINDMNPMQGMNSVSISNTSQTHQASQVTVSGTALARAGLMVILRNQV